MNGKKLGLLPNGAHPIVAMHNAEARKVCAATAYAVPSLSSAEVHVGFVDLIRAIDEAFLFLNTQQYSESYCLINKGS